MFRYFGVFKTTTLFTHRCCGLTLVVSEEYFWKKKLFKIWWWKCQENTILFFFFLTVCAFSKCPRVSKYQKRVFQFVHWEFLFERCNIFGVIFQEYGINILNHNWLSYAPRILSFYCDIFSHSQCMNREKAKYECSDECREVYRRKG